MSVTHPKCILEPMNLHDAAQFDELLRQRALCGWAKEPSDVASWRDAMDAGTKASFWIKPPSRPDLRAGHVSLDSETDPPDLDLANPHDKSRLTITRFFIVPELRGGGMGRGAMEALERCAREEPYGSPNCKVIALDTLSRRYYEDEECRALYEKVNGHPAHPRGRSNEDWYVRQGYVKFKERQKYPAEKEDYKLWAVYMEKTIA